MGESDLATSIPKMLTSPFAHFHNTKHSDMDYFFEYTCFGDNICKYITLYYHFGLGGIMIQKVI